MTNSKFRHFLAAFFIILQIVPGQTQCDPFLPNALSQRPANYDISLTLDDLQKSITVNQTIRFVNQSPVAIQTLKLYLYLNAFKNTESTFLKGAPNIFGQSFTDRKPEEWALLDIQTFDRESNGQTVSLHQNLRYAQSDDGNPGDQTVLEVMLDKALQPGETGVFHLNWKARMPKTIARAGYSRDFYLFCHWFPQLGVWEQNQAGAWDWNCHQFFRHTEFYADFGVYDVRITADSKFVMGASGCLVEEKQNPDGTTTRHYHAEDVIDFAWSVYPYFKVIEDNWKGVAIRILAPPEHSDIAPRYLHALTAALNYLEKHVAKYPYPSITVVDPPFHGLRSGLMEYPTLITVGTFYGMPEGIRTSESLVVHEFVHQYFMGILASNEKEEPWLDEGFVTYFEDRIIDDAYGAQQSLVDVLGYRFGNRDQTRIEYTTMRNPREGIVARPGWDFSDSNFKALIYSKTATSLRTLHELVGEAKMDQIIQAYFNQWKFKHPRGADFMAVLKRELQSLPDTALAQNAYALFHTAIYEAKVLDYAVTNITNQTLFAPQGVFDSTGGTYSYRDGSGERSTVSMVEVQRKGDWVYPVELLVTFEDGSTQMFQWSGEAGMHTIEIKGRAPVVSAQVDPQYKLGLDIDWNNNSMTLKPETAPLWKYTTKAIFWIQNLLQAASFLV